MKNNLSLGIVILGVLMSAVSGMAQNGNGIGYSTGIAQLDDIPLSLAIGEIIEMRLVPDEAALSGNDPLGVHLLIQIKYGSEIELYLGPVWAVETVLNQLSIGQTIGFEAFAIDGLPENTYIATRLFFSAKTIVLRDANLQPFWAQ